MSSPTRSIDPTRRVRDACLCPAVAGWVPPVRLRVRRAAPPPGPGPVGGARRAARECHRGRDHPLRVGRRPVRPPAGSGCGRPGGRPRRRCRRLAVAFAPHVVISLVAGLFFGFFAGVVLSSVNQQLSALGGRAASVALARANLSALVATLLAPLAIAGAGRPGCRRSARVARAAATDRADRGRATGAGRSVDRANPTRDRRPIRGPIAIEPAHAAGCLLACLGRARARRRDRVLDRVLGVVADRDPDGCRHVGGDDGGRDVPAGHDRGARGHVHRVWVAGGRAPA